MATFATIFPAAGRSSRFRDKEKKPFANLDGRAVWLRAAEHFVTRSPNVCPVPRRRRARRRARRPRRCACHTSAAFMNAGMVAKGGAEPARVCRHRSREAEADDVGVRRRPRRGSAVSSPIRCLSTPSLATRRPGAAAILGDAGQRHGEEAVDAPGAGRPRRCSRQGPVAGPDAAGFPPRLAGRGVCGAGGLGPRDHRRRPTRRGGRASGPRRRGCGVQHQDHDEGGPLPRRRGFSSRPRKPKPSGGGGPFSEEEMWGGRGLR